MAEENLEEMFEWAGLAGVYDRHEFKLWLSGMEKLVDRDLLEKFSDAYSIENAEEMHYDEFLFNLRLFKGICKNNELPPRY